RKFASHEMMQSATPNAGHRALARLVRDGKMSAIVTQNIDGLHQVSGVPDDKVIELHGNATYAACLDCRRRYELDWVRAIFAIDERLPLCTGCGGIIKTATISFGQSMPEPEMERAREVTLAADLFIVLGSSLVVYPAAGFPIMAKQNGSRLVIVNREPTDQDAMADLVIHAEIGSTMSRAVGVNCKAPERLVPPLALCARRCRTNGPRRCGRGCDGAQGGLTAPKGRPGAECRPDQRGSVAKNAVTQRSKAARQEQLGQPAPCVLKVWPSSSGGRGIGREIARDVLPGGAAADQDAVEGDHPSPNHGRH